VDSAPALDAETEIRQRFDWLTPREREVLTLLISGVTNKVAAETLRLSRRTVETHRGNILEKLRVKSNVELRELCERHRLLPINAPVACESATV